jgi:hypothetical protein
MNPIPTLSLDLNWKCAYFHGDPPPYDVFVPMPVGSLSGWSPNVSPHSGLVAHLFHLFYLEPTDFCVRYRLHVESAPGVVKLVINEREMGEFDGAYPFVCDVTDQVRLEDNLIYFQVACSARGKFGAVYLEQVPCE